MLPVKVEFIIVKSFTAQIAPPKPAPDEVSPTTEFSLKVEFEIVPRAPAAYIAPPFERAVFLMNCEPCIPPTATVLLDHRAPPY